MLAGFGVEGCWSCREIWNRRPLGVLDLLHLQEILGRGISLFGLEMSSSRDSSESPSCADRAVLCWAVQEHRPSRASPICGPGWFWAAPTFCAGPGTWPETLELWTGRRTSCWVPASPPGAGKALPVARGRPNCTVPAGAAAGSAGREEEEEEEDEEEAEQVARGWWGGDILPESPALGAGREGRAEPSISQQGGARPFPHSAPRGAQTTGVWEGR